MEKTCVKGFFCEILVQPVEYHEDGCQWSADYFPHTFFLSVIAETEKEAEQKIEQYMKKHYPDQTYEEEGYELVHEYSILNMNFGEIDLSFPYQKVVR